VIRVDLSAFAETHATRRVREPAPGSAVALSRREVEDYYHGFANRTHWSLLHGLVEQPVFERRWWRAYRDLNERFAAVEAGGADP
jgi:trehalose-6-phosphate synthase